MELKWYFRLDDGVSKVVEISVNKKYMGMWRILLGGIDMRLNWYEG